MCRGEVGVLYGQQRRRSVIMGNGRNLKCGRAGGGRREMRARCEAWVGSWLLGGGLWGLARRGPGGSVRDSRAVECGNSGSVASRGWRGRSTCDSGTGGSSHGRAERRRLRNQAGQARPGPRGYESASTGRIVKAWERGTYSSSRKVTRARR
jgi:hypothetical protein